MSARKKGSQKAKAEPLPVAKKARIYDYFAPKADADCGRATVEGDCKPAAVPPADAGRSASIPSQQESGSSSRGSSRGPSPLPTPSAPPVPPPLPTWGALIKPRIAQSWSFIKQHSRQPFLPMLAFTVTFKTVLQDSYFRAPGMGRASNGFWGGIRSALTAHTTGSWDGAGMGKGSPDGAESQEAVDEDGKGEGEASNAEAIEVQKQDPTPDETADDAGAEKGGERASQHCRNFGLICNWVLSSGLLVEEDVAALRQLLGLRVTSQGLFWKVYHSLRSCYRLDAQTLGAKPELKEAMQELISAGLLVDVAERVQQNDCGEWIAELDDVLCALHADEVKQVAVGMLGKAAIKNGTRDECVSSIEAALYTSAGPQAQNGTRVRLRLLTTALRGVLSGRVRSNGSRLVAIERRRRKLVHRTLALFFLSSGYEAEDAVVLLRSDMTRRVFPSIPPPRAPSQPSSPVKEKHGTKPLHYNIDRMYLGLADHLLALSDAVDHAATTGDADLAYGCLHAASNLLLQRPCPSPAPSPSLHLHLHHHSLSTLFPPTGPGSPPLESHLPPSFSCLIDLPVPLTHLLTRCVWKGIHLLQRENKYDESRHYLNMLLDATKQLPSSVRGRYWTRLLMSLEHQKCFVEALRVCDEALEDTYVDAEDRLYLQNKHAPLCKKAKRWTTRKFPPVRVADVLVLELSLRKDGPSEGKGVEDRTLDFLLGEEEGWKGLHCENGAFLTLFGLLFWDVLFHPLPGVFTTPYQSAPHDLHNRNFLERRKEVADRVLRRLERGDACVMLEKAYRDHWGKSCVGVDWTTWTLDDMKVIAQALGGSAVESICRTLASDYALWRHGLPDLLLWKPPQHYGGEAYVRCVEVKGPGDDLSWAQRAWLDRLLAAGVCVQVARVRDTDVAGGGGGGRRRRSRGVEEAEIDLGMCEEDMGD